MSLTFTGRAARTAGGRAGGGHGRAQRPSGGGGPRGPRDDRLAEEPTLGRGQKPELS